MSGPTRADREQTTTQPTVTLNNGVSIPQLGFGVFQVPPAETQGVVETAIEAGYRHIDTATAYTNEEQVGAAVAHCGLARNELFLTTKLRNGDQGYDEALAAFDQSCRRLGSDYVDLYLIHWPLPSADRYVDSWRALERLQAEGRARAVGVSNFLPEHLERLHRETEVVPAVNQIEVHPTYQQRELTDLCAERGIAVEAYSPLGQGEDLQHPTVQEIAGRHGRTPAQVVLRWHLSRGRTVIPKSRTASRIRSNRDLGGFALTPDELDAIDAMESGTRLGNDPRTFSLSQIR